MYSYKKEIDSIQQMLYSFLETKVINTAHLSKMDALIKRSDVDQIKTLNSISSLSTQRVIFGAIRNINTSLKGMKEKLRTAALRHENPTTAEQALELVESLSNVALCIDVFNSGEIDASEIDNIAKLSRILYKKAKAFGFSEDTQSQLKEACVNEAVVKSFISNFDSNLAVELDLEEEVKSTVKNNC
jgi:hypothetical protein